MIFGAKSKVDVSLYNRANGLDQIAQKITKDLFKKGSNEEILQQIAIIIKGYAGLGKELGKRL